MRRPSRDQANDSTSIFSEVRGDASPPSTGITQRRVFAFSPPREERKATVRLSEAHAGDLSSESALVSRRAAPPAVSTTQRLTQEPPNGAPSARGRVAA